MFGHSQSGFKRYKLLGTDEVANDQLILPAQHDEGRDQVLWAHHTDIEKWFTLHIAHWYKDGDLEEIRYEDPLGYGDLPAGRLTLLGNHVVMPMPAAHARQWVCYADQGDEEVQAVENAIFLPRDVLELRATYISDDDLRRILVVVPRYYQDIDVFYEGPSHSMRLKRLQVPKECEPIEGSEDDVFRLPDGQLVMDGANGDYILTSPSLGVDNLRYSYAPYWGKYNLAADLDELVLTRS